MAKKRSWVNLYHLRVFIFTWLFSEVQFSRDTEKVDWTHPNWNNYLEWRFHFREESHNDYQTDMHKFRSWLSNFNEVSRISAYQRFVYYDCNAKLEANAKREEKFLVCMLRPQF